MLPNAGEVGLHRQGHALSKLSCLRSAVAVHNRSLLEDDSES